MHKLSKGVLFSVVVALASCGGGGGGGATSAASCKPVPLVSLNFTDARLGNSTSWSNGFTNYFATLERVVFNPTLPELCGAQTTFGGSLPNGLTINASTGVISGTPTSPGQKSGTLSLSVAGFSGSASYKLDFSVDDIAFTYVEPNPTNATVGNPVSINVALNDGTYSQMPLGPFGGATNLSRGSLLPAGSVTTFALTSGTLPPGLVINPSTGQISGTPTVVGTSLVSVGMSATYLGTTFTPLTGGIPTIAQRTIIVN